MYLHLFYDARTADKAHSRQADAPRQMDSEQRYLGPLAFEYQPQ
jgi:hypothetical protein